jgi:hypothetical protein
VLERPTNEAEEVDAQKVQKLNLNLLSISHRYVFEKIFKYAAQQLRPANIPIIERIKLGDKYGLDDWLSSAYQELLDRPHVLDDQEITILGNSRIIQFLKAKNFMHEERLSIANHNTYIQKSRAEYAERTSNRYAIPVSRMPTGTGIVAKRFFFDS